MRNTLQHTATHCNTLQHTATHCNTLQHTATHCNTLQHIATHCNTLQHNAQHRTNVLDQSVNDHTTKCTSSLNSSRSHLIQMPELQDATATHPHTNTRTVTAASGRGTPMCLFCPHHFLRNQSVMDQLRYVQFLDFVCVRVRACVRASVCVCMYVHACVCVYAHVRICIRTYTNTCIYICI